MSNTSKQPHNERRCRAARGAAARNNLTAKQLLATLRDLRWVEASRTRQDRERTAQLYKLNARVTGKNYRTLVRNNPSAQWPAKVNGASKVA